MKQSLAFCVSSMLFLLATVAWAEPNASGEIRFARGDQALFLHGADVASVLGFELKIVQPGRLVTFCREGDEGFCVPLRLTESNHRQQGEELLLAAEAVSTALHFQAVEADGKVSLKRLAGDAQEASKSLLPGYNAEWGPGRGFSKGETLPDIPLVDLDGNEVRLSAFLGKRYILYCWASW